MDEEHIVFSYERVESHLVDFYSFRACGSACCSTMSSCLPRRVVGGSGGEASGGLK